MSKAFDSKGVLCVSLRFRKGRANSSITPELLADRKVQLLLGWFVQGDIESLQPALDQEEGIRYPALDPIVDDPSDAETFLESLADNNILDKHACGYVLSCKGCGAVLSLEVEMEDDSSEDLSKPVFESIMRCRRCGSNTTIDESSLRPVYSYTIHPEAIEDASSMLLVKPLIEFLTERGFTTHCPGTMAGRSDIRHQFDIVAYPEGRKDRSLVIDFAISHQPHGEAPVIAMFAKSYDCNPFKSLIVAIPRLTESAKLLAKQYGIECLETKDTEGLWKKLIRVIPPASQMDFETLDVMTLLALPDHLRKAASIVCDEGRITAGEVSDMTRRSRAVESGYLNQLVRMGYLRKDRGGRRVYFSVRGDDE